jgi:iron-sulfur cluster repair protein YtfE (RIC family)
MRPRNDWLFPSTKVESLLLARPRAAEVLERLGIDPWANLSSDIGEACARQGIAWDRFLAEMEALAVPASGSDWRKLPISHLLDRLVEEHRAFRREFLPAIGRALSEDWSADPASLEWLQGMAGEWPAFSGALTDHLREEEQVLFPRLLRYEASLRRRSVDPLFAGGSARVFASLRMIDREHRDSVLLRAFLEKALPARPAGAVCALEERLRPLFMAFRVRLRDHARLETEVLYPMAASLEKTLYDRHIGGSCHRNLPMTPARRPAFCETP